MADTTVANNSPTDKPITPDYYLSNKKNTRQTGNGSLDKDAFLQLLVTQLQYQDPTSPMDDKEFISQLAQFSSLEQMQNVSKSIDSLADISTQSQLIQYNSFIGKSVNWNELSSDVDEKGKPIVNSGSGIVSKVSYNGDSVIFTLADGKKLSPANISEVLNGTSEKSTANSLMEASMLIGKNVTYTDEDQETTATVKSVKKTSDGNIVLVLSNDKEIQADQLSSITQ